MHAVSVVRQWFAGLFSEDPWTDVYALGRSLIALSPLLSLLFNPTWVLFHPNPGIETHSCDGLMGTIGLFCVVPSLELARWIGIAVLLVAVAGWRPRWFAIPHAWVAISFHNAIMVTEGGDQIAGNLALLLLPVALMDGRRWHWRTLGGANQGIGGGDVGHLVSNTMLALIRLQVCVVYLHAAIGKLAVTEWLDGTAIYYWSSETIFGPTGIRGTLFGLVAETTLGATLLTWGTIVLELGLAFGLVATMRTRRGLFWAGVAFHMGIALMLGLVTFGIAMTGALLLFLWPRQQPPTLVARLSQRVKRIRTARLPMPAEVDDHNRKDHPPAASAPASLASAERSGPPAAAGAAAPGTPRSGPDSDPGPARPEPGSG